MTEESTPAAPPEDGAVPARAQRLSRAQDGRIIMGICAGLARQTGVDAVIFRVGFGLMVFVNGWGILLYVAAALIMPADPSTLSRVERTLKRRLGADAMLMLLGMLLALGVLTTLSGSGFPSMVTAIVVLAFVVLASQARGVNLINVARTLPERMKDHPAEEFDMPVYTGPGGLGAPGEQLPPGAIDLAALDPTRPYVPPPPTLPPPRRRSDTRLTGVTLALSAAAGAATVPFTQHRPVEQSAGIGLAAALAVVAVGILVSTWFARSGGLFAVGALLSLGLVVAALPAATGLGGGEWGDLTWRPIQATAAEQTHKVILGRGRLDLLDLALKPGQRAVFRADLGVGRLEVTVPANVRVELTARTQVGDIELDHRMLKGNPGRAVRETLAPETPTSNPPVIVIDARTRVGEVVVDRV
jgi:phage shock protein PspC (stress-responsive transcriptional regulator)